MTRKVAIVGTAASSVEMANRLPPDVEIWTCTGGFALANRSDTHFELHMWEDLPGAYKGTWEKYEKFLLEHKGIVYMPKVMPEVPRSVPYPLDRVLETFPADFGSTVAYMAALAALEGATEVHFYGVDMSQDEEYAHQRRNLLDTLKFIKKMWPHIDIIIPENSMLLARTLYAFDPLYDEQINLRHDITKATKEIADLQWQVKAAMGRRMVLMNILDRMTGIRSRENYNAVMNDMMPKKAAKQVQEHKLEDLKSGKLPPGILALQQKVLKEHGRDNTRSRTGAVGVEETAEEEPADTIRGTPDAAGGPHRNGVPALTGSGIDGE